MVDLLLCYYNYIGRRSFRPTYLRIRNEKHNIIKLPILFIVHSNLLHPTQEKPIAGSICISHFFLYRFMLIVRLKP